MKICKLPSGFVQLLKYEMSQCIYAEQGQLLKKPLPPPNLNSYGVK